jgi:hypothetical protein
MIRLTCRCGGWLTPASVKRPSYPLPVWRVT